MGNDPKTATVCSPRNPARGRTFRISRRQTARKQQAQRELRILRVWKYVVDFIGVFVYFLSSNSPRALIENPNNLRSLTFYSSSISFVLEFLSFLISSRSTVWMLFSGVGKSSGKVVPISIIALRIFSAIL